MGQIRSLIASRGVFESEPLQLVGSLLGGLANSLNTAYNFVITGSDNHDDLLWGTGDYDDVLDGKSGNDQYWAFNGMNSITDESGNDVYHFFTTNMQGITTINDGDGLGSITLDNYGNCNIQSRGIVLANILGTGNVVFAFYPNDPNTGCQPDSTFSSQVYGILNDYHNNDIFFLQLLGQTLMITLNSIAISPSKYGTIVINNFQDGHVDISLNGAGSITSNTKIYYVSVAAGEVLKCDFNHDSYLFSLIGSSTYMSYDNNPYNCVMVGNSDAANTFIFKSGYVKGQNVKAHSSATTGTSTIQGYKSGDLIDVSAFNSSSVSFQQDVVDGQVTMTLSNGVTILLPSVYNNISYTVDGKNNLTFVPTIVSPFNTTTITPTVTVSPTPSPTNSDTTTISSTPSPTNIDTSMATLSFATSSSETKSTESNNNGLYIGVAVGASIVGIAATSALILYCYKKRQKNKPRILPGTIASPNKETNTEVIIPEATITNSDIAATRSTNITIFSTTLQRTAQTYAPTTEQLPSNPVPFSLSSPSTLDGGELYPHYYEAESTRSHSPSSRQFLVR